MEAGLPLASKAGPPRPGLALGLFGGRAQARQRHPARGYYRHAHAHGRSQKGSGGAGWPSAQTAAPSHTHRDTRPGPPRAAHPRERAGRALGGDTCTGLGGVVSRPVRHGRPALRPRWHLGVLDFGRRPPDGRTGMGGYRPMHMHVPAVPCETSGRSATCM